MLGFHAEYTAGDPSPAGVAISEARASTADDLGSVDLPPQFSISRQLIDDWVERQRNKA